MERNRRSARPIAGEGSHVKRYVWIALVLMILLSAPVHDAHTQTSTEAPPFELVDGDRVVLVGGTFIEAAQDHGYVELALTTRWPDRNVIFRNVGWAGDTVFGDARAHYTNPPGPYERLLDEVSSPDPTVVIVGYGSTVPFEGDGALDRFEDGLNRLLGDLERETGARLILLAPPPHEAETSPAPSELVRRMNESLRQVSEAIERVARTRGHWYVDLFSALEKASGTITEDGVHLNATGYYLVARAIEEALGLAPRGWSVDVDLMTGLHTAEAASVTVEVEDDAVTIRILPANVPVAPPAAPPGGIHPAVAPVGSPSVGPDGIHPTYGPLVLRDELPDDVAPEERRLRVTGLERGTFSLTAGETPLARASSDAWEKGIRIAAAPDDARSDRLRRLIIEKNRLFFHQYRPQNETYLLGFRSYEQGQNAQELSHFGRLIDEKELEIGRLRMPVPVTLKLTAVP